MLNSQQLDQTSQLDSQLKGVEKPLIQQLDDLKKLEGTLSISQSKQEITQMKNVVEQQKYEKNPLMTYTDVVKDTPLATTLYKVLAHPDFQSVPEFKDKTPEQRAEYLFRKINVTLSRFYANRLGIAPEQPVPEYLHQVIVPATERFLMDMLKYNQHSNNVNFLGNLSGMSMESISGLFADVKAFAEKFSFPYQKAKNLMHMTDFLTQPQVKHHLSKLKNPYDFYQKLMQSPIWEEEKLNVQTLSLSQFSLLDLQNPPLGEQEFTQQLLKGKDEMRAMIGSIQMVDSPETAKKLVAVVERSEQFFLKSHTLSNALLDQMDQFKSVDATMRYFGIDVFKEIQESKFMKGIVNFFLGLLGFGGGIEGLERSWRRRAIDRELTPAKKDYISATLQSYAESKQVETSTAQSLISRYQLNKLNSKYHQKFALDMPTLQEKMLENLTNEKMINPQTLAALSTKTFKGKEYVITTKDAQGQVISRIKPEFFASEDVKKAYIEAYSYQALHQLSSNTAFLEKVEDADTLAFTLIAGVSLESDNLIEGVKAQALLPAEFYEKPEQPSAQNSPKNPEKTDSTEQSAPSSLSTKLRELILQGESNFNYGSVNKDDVGSVSIGLMQWHASRAVDLLKKLQAADPAKFAEQMSDPLFADLDKAGMAVWNYQQSAQFDALMQGETFQKVMDQQVENDLAHYIREIKKWGITDPQALLTMGRIYNAGSAFAFRIFKSLEEHGKDPNDYQAIISAYNATAHGKENKLFAHKNKDGLSLEENIAAYQANPFDQALA